MNMHAPMNTRSHAVRTPQVPSALLHYLFFMALALAMQVKVIAQTAVIDSLYALLNSAKATSTLADTSLASQHLRLAAKLSKAGMMDSAFAQAARAEALLSRLERSFPEQQRIHGMLAVANRHMGRLKYFDSLYDESLRYMQLANRHAQVANDSLELGRSLMYMGACFREMNDTTQALAYTRQAMPLLESTGQLSDLGVAIMSIGGIYTNSGVTDSALYHFKNAHRLFLRIDSRSQIAASLLNIAGLYNNIGRHDSVHHYLALAAPYAHTMSPPAQVRYHGMLGRDHTIRKEFSDALVELALAEELADGNPSDLAEILHVKALALAGSHDMPAAMTAMRSGYDAMVNDLDLAKVQAVTEQRLAFEHEEQQRIADAALAMEQQRKRNSVIVAVGTSIIALLLLVLLFTARRNAARIRQKNDEIVNAQAQLVAAEKQRENEAVRTRIARDLHDEMGGELTKISLLSAEARRQVPSEQGTLSETLTRIAELSRSAHGALHDVVHATDASTDSSTALVEQARTIAHRLLDNSPVQHTIDVEHRGADIAVGPATKRDLLMILKEAINNALKHAQAQRIEVSLRVEDGRYKLEVADDGKGFDPALAPGGNGLRNMRLRAERAHADMTLASNGSPGTRLILTGRLA